MWCPLATFDPIGDAEVQSSVGFHVKYFTSEFFHSLLFRGFNLKGRTLVQLDESMEESKSESYEPALGIGWLCKNLESVFPAKTGEDGWICFFPPKNFSPRSPVKHRGSAFLPSFFLIGCSLCGVSDPKKGFGVVSMPNLATNGNHTLLLRIPPELIVYTLSETNSSHLKLMVVILLSFWEGFLAGANCQF